MHPAAPSLQLAMSRRVTLCACCATPRCTGVYFEKYVKGKFAASLWVRNIQLGMFGVPLR